LHTSVGIMSRCIDHRPRIIGDNSRRIYLVCGVIVVFALLGSVFGDEAAPHVDIVPEACSVDIIFGKEPAVEGIDIEGADR